MNILTKFPGTPRPVQISSLNEIEAVWDRADVIVVQLPVASGKSRIAVALARWMQTVHKMRSRILTPTNILVDQYLQDFPTMVTLSAQDKYICPSMSDNPDGIKWNCKDVKAELGHFSKGCCYMKALKRAHAVPYGVFTLLISCMLTA
jgi:superfamily II DNA or RNA helicase